MAADKNEARQAMNCPPISLTREMGAILCGGRLCDSLLKAYAENGFLDRCLKRSRELNRG